MSDDYQPDWSKAPKGAQFWTRDQDGTARFWEHRPTTVGNQFCSALGTYWPDTDACPNWRETLQERPAPAPDRNDWSNAPDWARARAWGSSGYEYWLDTSKPTQTMGGWVAIMKCQQVSDRRWPSEGWKDSLLLRPTDNTTEIRKIREELAALTERLAKLEVEP
jgi:hypothetical protein